MCKPGSVGDLGGQPPRSTRPDALLIVGILGTLIPLRIGIKAFRRMEF